jgi:hypothetical protein
MRLLRQLIQAEKRLRATSNVGREMAYLNQHQSAQKGKECISASDDDLGHGGERELRPAQSSESR